MLDHEAQKPRLSLVGPEILLTLQRPETDDPENHHTKWRPEYASYMIEGTGFNMYMYYTTVSYNNFVPVRRRVRTRELNN